MLHKFLVKYLSISQKMSNFAPAFGVFAFLGISITLGNRILYYNIIKFKTKQNDHCTRKRRREHRARAEEV